ncbi:hypothetical protein FRB96_005448 [Tulasnella sp. 330]|nr:hypothetical protein FRB96_005448 [Tulasnella sp. 330]KAG8881978.1 hypothetical protein FRB97_008846 [Tulasnella sp. 331]
MYLMIGQQQQQRPPNLPQAPTGMQYARTGAPGGYPPAGYSITPRGTIQQQSYPTAMQSRTAQQHIVSTTPGYLPQQQQPQRAGSGNYFGPTSTMNLPMQPSPNNTLSSLQQQVPQQSSIGLHQQHAQQQQQQASSNIALHLGGGAANHSTGPGSVTSDNVIDQSDFPPLGSTTAGNGGMNSSSSLPGSGNLHSTYASQAGTAVGNGQTVATTPSGNTTQQRDLGHDDFPPLGANQPQHQQGAHGQSQVIGDGGAGGHTNGFTSGTPNQTQDALSRYGNPALQQAQRGLQQGLPSELDKRNFAKMNAASQLPWSQQPTPSQAFPNGQHLGAPPNLPTPSSYNGQSFSGQQTSQQMQQMQQHGLQQHGVGQQDLTSLPQQARQSGSNQAQSAPPPSSQHSQQQSNHAELARIAQTPAQQILLSPADRWGLLALLANIKGMDPDSQLLGAGTDLAQMGLDLSSTGNISATFVTPWADINASQSVEPEFHLPLCYNVQAPAPGPQKVGAFSDETLFFMFYSSPRDTLQEIAAQELYNRNWRFHKEARVWLTKESGQSPVQKDTTHERGSYTFFDHNQWIKVKKEAIIYYEHLEERALNNGGSNGVVNGNMGVPPTMGGMPGQNQPQPQQIPLRG